MKRWLSQPTSRRGAYFRAELAESSSVPLWLGITNLAVLNQGTNADLIATNLGHLLLPQTPETFTHDLDGNLTSDSLWTNMWNAENRRTVIESGTGVPPVARVRQQWAFLPDGRWIERIVATHNGTGYFAMQTNRYVWDGNVLVAVLNHTNGLELAFLRGLDMGSAGGSPALSGGLAGQPHPAGGVGGLLAVQVGPAGPPAVANTTHFACYDGNGNVMALVNAADGTESARYEYGPFGEPLRITGPLGRVNPLRFSTQYADDWTGELHYLYRSYRSDLGRWLSRDPLGEKAGLHLFALLSNAPTLDFDLGGGIAWNVFAKHAAECLKDLVKAGILNSFTEKVNVGAACAQLPIESGKMGDSICKGGYEFPMGKGFIAEPSSLGKEMMKCVFGKLSERALKGLIDKADDAILKNLLEKLRDEGVEGAMGLVDGTVDFQFMARATCRKGVPHVTIFSRTTVGIGQTTANVDSRPIAEGTCDGIANILNVVNLMAVPCCCPRK